MGLDEILTVKGLKEFLYKKIINDEGKIEIYNEFSFQYELGKYLSDEIGDDFYVNFERNITYFKIKKGSYVKSEIDLAIYDSDMKHKYAIELKYPAHSNGVTGEYPERMKQFDKDITFMKELSNKFTSTYCIVLVDDHNFYEGKFNEGSDNEKYYRKYRNDRLWEKVDEEGKYRFYIKKFKNGKEL